MFRDWRIDAGGAAPARGTGSRASGRLFSTAGGGQRGQAELGQVAVVPGGGGFEGQRIHDIRRQKGTVDGLNWDDDKLVFPIPEREIEVNKKLVQNSGY